MRDDKEKRIYLRELAHSLSRHTHFGQKYGDKSYFTYHVQGVAAFFDDQLSDEHIVALLHDVCEDHPDTIRMVEVVYTIFGKTIGEAVDLLTKIKDEDYFNSYIKGIYDNPIAKAVKIADLKFHLSQPELKNEDKYRKALAFLEDKL